MIKYAPTHEYILVEGTIAYVGISPYAAKQLGNIVYVEMPFADDSFAAGEAFGAIESVKAASDLFAPVSCTILESNPAVENDPTLVGANPLENWIVKVEITDPSELDSLMDAAEYDKHCEAESH